MNYSYFNPDDTNRSIYAASPSERGFMGNPERPGDDPISALETRRPSVIPVRPPVGGPPVGRPPVGGPPVGRPPVGRPPVGGPPVGRPPVGRPPVGGPPVGRPPVGGPPTGSQGGIGGRPSVGPNGAPLSAPPSQTPQKISTFRVDPGSIRRCIGSFTYVWLNNGNSFWIFPVQVGRDSVSGFRWVPRFGWVFFGVSLNRIDAFMCV